MRHWLEDEFDRTGLPRAALAAYLGVDAALISRIARGDRPMLPEENELARAFFSLVSPEAKPTETEAIGRLKITKRRDAAAFELSRWLLENYLHEGTPLGGFLKDVLNKTAMLSADQIVALCRFFDIEIDTLVQAGKVCHRSTTDTSRVNYYRRTGDHLKLMEEEASSWSKHSPPYRFDRAMTYKRPAPSPKHPYSPLEFAPSKQRYNDIFDCNPYVVASDTFAPRFQQGQTIFLERARSEPRKGDYVAVFTAGANGEIDKAVLGELIYFGERTIAIVGPKNLKLEIPRETNTVIARIAYCKL